MNQSERPTRPVASNLSIEETATARQRTGSPAPAPDPAANSDFNPYNRSGEDAVKSADMYRGPPRPPSRIIVTSREQPGLIKRLLEWIFGRGKTTR
jgi:hypothetical protein